MSSRFTSSTTETLSQSQRGTAYNLLNAITNYTDHERSTKEDMRAESAMFGSGDALKTKAMEVIYETARGLDSVPQVMRFHAQGSTGSAVLDSVMEATIAG